MVSVARLVTTAAVAGGLLAGSVALGAGVASAAPAPSRVVPASCGQTVSALPGDTVRVKPKFGATQDYVVGGTGTTRIPSTLERPDCEVDVQVRAPAAAPAPMAAYPMAAYPVAPAPMAAAPVAPAPAAAPVAAAPVPAARAAAPAPAAPVPAAGRSTASRASRGTGTAASSVTDGLAPGAALPAIPSLPLGAPMAPAPPAAAPAAPDAQVLATRNTAALTPADDSHGLGVPVLIALIAGTGVAAFGVRMVMLRRGSTAAHAAARHDDPFASVAAVDPAEETALVDAAEARTVVGSRA
jgi:hypothetical protein